MVLPMDGAIGAVQIAIDEVRAIANGAVDLGAQDATSAKNKFEDAHIGATHFSEVPRAAGLAAQQTEVHDVFAKTIQGVVEDLENFRDTLVRCAKDHQATDEQTQAALTALGKRMRDHHWRSDTAAHRAAKEHGGAYGSSGDGDGDGSGSDGSQPTGSQPGGSPDGGSGGGSGGGSSSGSSGGPTDGGSSSGGRATK